MKHCLLILISAFGLASSSFAAEQFWLEGKDHPELRVNVDLKTLAPDAYLKIAERMNGAVVNISTTQVIRSPRARGPRRGPGPNQPGPRGPNPFDDLFEDFFFGPFSEMPQPERRAQSLGSGFILNSAGYIVTNNHVVEQAEKVKVVLADDSEFEAKVVGRDPKTDVALLKIEPKNVSLKSVVLGDSDRMRVGEVVVAIGNPFGLSNSVTQGIVSAKERSIGAGPYDDFIQTDASINPGNSGGPLLDLQGEVIGINAAIVSSGAGGSVGIGFAIPINLAKKVLLSLRETGKVVRGRLGVLIQKVGAEHAAALKLPDKTGALVSDVQEDSPAKKAGIKVGDVVTRFDGKRIKDWHELPIAVANTPVGKKVQVEVIRDGKQMTFSVTIVELKDEEVETSTSGPVGSDRLGMTVQKLTPEMASSLDVDKNLEAVVVTEIDPNGAAYAKGIRQGDIILEVNRKRVPTVAAYKSATSKLKKGDTVLVLVKRGASTLFVAFTLP
ncbi:MAG TPA: DegQ family serine endoprotease [Bdellovibrionota bacterium]|nr:DegQ family serine endoprotease [Bdellovibrionota bacterium]